MTNIIVAFPKIEDAKNVKNLLVRNGFDVAAICVTGAQAIHYADGLESGIIICAYKFHDMLYSEIKSCLPKGFEMLLLASRNHLINGMEENVVTLPMPFVIRDLLNTIDMMSQAIVRRKKKKRQIVLQRSEDEQKIIKTAKMILMERNHLTEEDAHRYIQKCSMESGTNMVETARMVLSLMKE